MLAFLKGWRTVAVNTVILLWATMPDVLNYLVGIDIHAYFPSAPGWVIPALAVANIMMRKFTTGPIGTKQ